MTSTRRFLARPVDVALLASGTLAPRQQRLYDITPAITEKLGVWPGDTPPSREVLCDTAKGDTVTLSTLRATVHRQTQFLEALLAGDPVAARALMHEHVLAFQRDVDRAFADDR